VTEPRDPPPTIGPYRILRRLGEGGMGIVYLAEQREPVRREVALKVLRPELADAELVVRFAAERQALAMMDHPGIARIYRAGSTSDGRPWFAMELVSGLPLNEFADQQRLSLEARINLFVECCRAVHHAHQKGIIHRDLKPSNILVTEDQGKAHSKIIDFGIAKAIGQRLTDETLVTRFGRTIGTPAYMSPEQADSTNLDIDIRTDVYSLGAILYELLVGCLPLDPREVGYAAFLTQLQSLATDSPTPSSRFTTLAADQQARAALLRGTDPSRLRQRLAGDLGWVVMKALEKDRDRRYDSANALADDLERYLANEPIAARPPSAAYRFGKFVRRHRAGVVAAGLVLATVVAGAITATVGFVRASREAETASQVSDFLGTLFGESDPSVSRGAPVTAREVLDSAAVRIRSQLASQPLVLGRLMLDIGNSYRALNLLKPALPLLEQATVDLTQGGAGPLELATAQHDYGYALVFAARYDSAEALLRRAWQTRRRRLGDGDASTVEALNNLVFAFLRSQTHVAEGDSLLRVELPIQLARHGLRNEATSLIMYHHAWALRLLGHAAESDSMYGATLALRRQLYGGDHPQIEYALLGLAQVQSDLGRLDSALVNARAALAMDRRLYHGDFTETAYTLRTVAQILLRLGQPDSALAYATEASAMLGRVLDSTNSQQGDGLMMLGDALTDRRRFDPAEAAYREALAVDSGKFGMIHPRVAAELEQLGMMHLQAGDAAQASRDHQRALAIVRELPPENRPARLHALLADGESRYRLGALTEAERSLREGLAIAQAAPTDYPVELATAEVRLARVLTALDRPAEACALARAGLEARQRMLPPGHWQIGEALTVMGRCLQRAGQAAQGDSALVQARSILRASRLSGDLYRRDAEQAPPPTQ
jgi:eukaryotic-like serine/threonine-protein kinase